MRVELLTRFQNSTEQQKVIDHLKNGQTNIVIATHRLLSPDVAFAKLGLVIIDEEQQGGCVTNKFVPLTNFKIGDNELSFSKEHYGEKLDYIFTKNEEEGIWIGNYYHGEELLGPSKCVVTQIKKDFFYKPKE